MREVSLSGLISQISLALDAVEADLMGATPYHSKRVALLSLAMGRRLGYERERLFCLGGCALLHDNALTEYILSERPNREQKLNLKTHCEIGEKNCSYLPFPRGIEGFILYHHERADGSGVFQKGEGEYPREAGIIALADQIDVRFHLQKTDPARIGELRDFIRAHTGSRFSPEVARAALEALDGGILQEMKDERIKTALAGSLPELSLCLTGGEIIRLSGIVAKIIDYKSRFTCQHTTQIANKAWYMCGIYGYDKEQRAAVYLAASLHDIGKLFIPSAILEKPGSLTEEEFRVIQSHVSHTWRLLEPVGGFQEIAVWASDHHEKLDGTGYPFGKTAAQLDFNSRLLACLDIYQAVREARPYHPARSHQDTMKILYEMAGRGIIDPVITRDLDQELSALEDGYAPYPCMAEPLHRMG